MAFKIDGFVALTGGGTGALDKISVADKVTNDAALGVVSSVFYVYRYNSASSAAEDPPNIIAPDSGTGRWELVFMVDTDTAMTADADNRTPSQKAVKYYIDGLIDAANGLVYKGAIDCSVSPFPNYPTANAGHCYVVSGAGRVGGESGELVEIGDMLLCKVDSSAEGDQATVGANWDIIQKNLTFPLTVAQGGTGVVTLTDHGLMIGSGTDAVTSLGAATDGQIPIGSTGGDPVLATITEGDRIVITNEAGAITIAAELPNHNDTLNIQGGAAGEYYHLTSALNAVVTAETAQSILGNPTGSPAVASAITVAEQTLVGRITGGNVDDLSVAQVKTLIGDVSDTAYAASWDGITTIAPSKNAVYDEMELRAPKANPTFSGLITTAGQIKFPATQSASSDVNTLDDYEEGATIGSPTATSGTFTTANYNLYYTKIGRVVAVSIQVYITTVGSAAGFVLVPLPFTPSGHAAVIGREGNVKGNSLVGRIDHAANDCIICTYNNLTPIGAGHYLKLSGVYHTAT